MDSRSSELINIFKSLDFYLKYFEATTLEAALDNIATDLNPELFSVKVH